MRHRRANFLLVVVLLAALLSLLAFFGELGWRIDLLAQFRFQALLGGLALVIASALLRARLALIGGSMAVALNAYALYDVPLSGAAPPNAPLARVVAFNLLGNDRPIDNVVAWLRQQQFDVVSFEELTPSFAAQIETLADIYPYRLMAPRKGGFGIGLISRHPLLEQDTLFPIGSTFPVLRVKVALGDMPTEIVVVHPPPPLGAPLAKAHDALLAALAQATPDPHRIVMGDFNAAPTSLALRHMMRQLDLGGAGRMPRLTWPTDYPWPLRIPIDHVLVGRGLALINVEIGPNLGSDHFPQIAAVARLTAK